MMLRELMRDRRELEEGLWNFLRALYTLHRLSAKSGKKNPSF
jgi:hypothetical protein